MHRHNAHHKLHPILDFITSKGINHTLLIDEHDTHFLSVIIGTLSIGNFTQLQVMIDELDPYFPTHMIIMGDLLSLMVTIND